MLSRSILVAVALVATVVTVALPDAKTFPEPALARIVFTHLPCAILTCVFLVLSAFVGLRGLSSRDVGLDVRLGASLELGALFGVLTMATGVLFSRVQWGAWWHWDPRQTSFLVVLMLQAAGLALRASHTDPAKRLAASSAYALASLLPALFLVFVFPRLPQVRAASLHPSQTVASGGFDTNYWIGIVVMGTALALWARAAYVARVGRGEDRIGLEGLDERVDLGRDRAAATGVVVPLGIPEER